MLWFVPGRAALRWPTNDVVTLVTSAPDYAVGVTDEPLVGDRDAVGVPTEVLEDLRRPGTSGDTATRNAVRAALRRRSTAGR